MTEDEGLAKLAELIERNAGDAEVEHIEADGLAVLALRALGWERLAEALRQRSDFWWYA